jgi:ABC-type spermidine/putrescine transport system permease subunit II
MFITPWLVSDMLRAFGWQLLLSPVGIVSHCWMAMTGLRPLDHLRYNCSAVVLGLVSSMLPAGVLCVFAAIPSRNRNEWLAAAETGSRGRVFCLMVFGRARAGILFGAIAVFILACFASAEARYLDGPTQTSIQTIAASLVNAGVPALLAFGSILLVLLFCAGLIGRIIYRYCQRVPTPQEAKSHHKLSALRVQWRASLWKQVKFVIARWSNGSIRLVPIAGCISVVLCNAPIVAVIAEAFWQPDISGGHWTVENFRLLLSSSELVTAFSYSAFIGLGVGVISALLAFVLSLVVWNNGLQRWVLIMIVMLVVLPGDVYAIGVIQSLKLIHEAQGHWLLVMIAHILWALPFATGTLLLANQHLSDNMLRASMEYARGPLAVIIRIVGRINLGRIIGVALLGATLSLNEYLRAAYLGGGLLTINNVVHGRLVAGFLPQNRGIFAAEVLIVVVSIAAVAMLLLVGIDFRSRQRE